MNWDEAKGKWKEIRGRVRQEFAKLTDDDMEAIHGRRDELVGRIQQRYGVARDEAERRVDDVIRKF